MNDESDHLSMGEGSNLGEQEGTSVRRQRKKRSICWESFRMLPLGSDKIPRAKCQNCGREYVCSGSSGTSSMKRHHESCKKVSDSPTPNPTFEYDVFVDMLIKGIIRHDLPFSFVKYEGIRDTFQYVLPSLKLPCRNTVKNHVLDIFEAEKSSIQRMLDSVQGRICLTSDLWTSAATDGYLTLTAHFMDHELNLQKRVLNFCHMPPPHNGIALAEKVGSLISEWGIEKKLFSITLDNASANDSFVFKLMTQLNSRGLLLMNGKFFHMRCCAHILNLIVQDGLKSIYPSVLKVRDCIKYIKVSMARKYIFFDCVEKVGLGSSRRGLRQDVPTRWNSTYLMLDSAIFYRRALGHMELVDKDFLCCPSDDEWETIKKVSKFLGYFYDVTSLFSGTKYPTSSLFFPKVFVIQHNIRLAMMDTDHFMRTMGFEMNAKFEKYWSDYSLILGIATILDPRYKLQFVEWAYEKIYGADSIQLQLMKETLSSLFKTYAIQWGPATNQSDFAMGQSSQTEGDDLFEDFDSHYTTGSIASVQSELNQYLDEIRLPRKEELNISAWWKVNQFRYPILFHLACDVLAIPISTFAFESAFSVGGRVLDQYPSSLLPETVQALLCTRDWLFGRSQGKNHVKDEELTEDIFDLSLMPETQSGFDTSMGTV